MKFSIPYFIFLLALFSSISLPAQIYMEKKNGMYKEKYANGNIITTGEIKDHYKTGEWKSYSFDGTPTTVYTYSHGILNGPYKVYFTNGKLEKEGNYTNGKITGEEKIYLQNGTLKSIKHFNSEGKREGAQLYYNLYGTLIEYDFYGTDGSRRIFSYSHKGGLSMRRYYQDEKKEGTQYFYQETKSNNPLDTFPNSIETYHKGIKEGAWLHYGKNHVLQSESYYKKGLLDSVAREWNYDGSLKYEFHYKAGELHGHCINYEKGKIFAEGNYENGKLQGMHTQYQPELCYSWFKDDEMDSCKCYFQNKALRLRYDLIDARNKKQFGVEYDSLGRKTKDYELKENNPEGFQHYYHPNGKVKSICEFKNDVAIGELKAWNSNGKLILKVVFDSIGQSKSLMVWSDAGVKLKNGTPAFNEQVKKYLPAELHYDESSATIYSNEKIEDSIQETDEELPYIENIEVEQPEQVFSFAEEMPSFPDFNKYLKENIKYPEKERSEGKQGTVYVNFTVERDGSISNVKIVKGIPGAPGFDKETIRVISAMPKWIPGKMNGRTVRVQMTQPVRFVL